MICPKIQQKSTLTINTEVIRIKLETSIDLLSYFYLCSIQTVQYIAAITT
jgi:hypothetical protein